MWEALLSFFSNLILVTAGLAVALLWVVIIIVIIIEAHDTWDEYRNGLEEEDDA